MKNESKPQMMKQDNTAKYTIKDSVFLDLFGDKNYLFQMYQTLHPEDVVTEADDLRNITIKNVLTNGMYNDLGFLAGERLLILVEAQSSWTVNIIIRSLMYLVQTYHDYFESTDQDLYASKKVEVPKPEIYIVYTGSRKRVPDEISFSDEFFDGEASAIEVRVKVIYGSSGKDIVSQYIMFTKVYNEQMKKYGRTRVAVMETIRICKDSNVLKAYLESREKEVVSIMMSLFDDEYILRTHIASEKREVRLELASKLLAAGKITEEDVEEFFPGITLKAVRKWEEAEKDEDDEEDTEW